MKILSSRLVLSLLPAFLLVAGGSAVAADSVSVAVTAIVEHPALDATRDGIRDELEAAGYKEGENLEFRYESAQGNAATAVQIARKFVGDSPDVIVPISTPSAQAVVAATQDIPIVFTAVTDPVGAKLIKDPGKPGGNVTGMSDLSPIGKQLDLIHQVLPDARVLGVPYNPGEANAVSLVAILREQAPARGFKLIEVAATKSSEVLGAAQSLIGKVDAIYVPTDNTIVSALESVLKVGMDSRTPVFAGDTDSVARGAIAAVGFNYYDVGRQTGKMVVQVLQGKNPGDMPVQGVEITELYLNPGAAEKMGVTFSPQLLESANKVVQ